jgi:hypothetical protein
MVKRVILAVLVAFILEHAPFKLAALVCETMFVHGGKTRVSTGNDKYWDALELEARIIGFGYSVAYQKDPKAYGRIPVYGMTDTEARTIVVDADLSWNARFAVLAHEVGHVFQPGWVDNKQAEVFAEAVATIVAGDGIREHARYLRQARGETVLMIIAEWQSIYAVADFLTRE